jgi:hypothetical protein
VNGGRSRFIHKAGSRHRDGPQGGWGTKPRSGMPNPCGPGSALREHGWRSVDGERGAWSVELGRRRRAALGEYGRQQCAVQRSATRPRARQGQPGPVKGGRWVEEQAAWSCWIARPEGDDSRRVAVRSTPAMHLQRPKRRGQAGVRESKARQPEPQARLGKGKRGRGGGPPLLSGSRRAWSSVRKRAGRGR